MSFLCLYVASALHGLETLIKMFGSEKTDFTSHCEKASVEFVFTVECLDAECVEALDLTNTSCSLCSSEEDSTVQQQIPQIDEAFWTSF